MKTTYVYMFWESNSDYFKIGVSGNPRERRFQLQSGNPKRIIPAAIWEYENQKEAFRAEGEAKRHFSKLRRIGEWYEFSNDADYSEAFIVMNNGDLIYEHNLTTSQGL